MVMGGRAATPPPTVEFGDSVAFTFVMQAAPALECVKPRRVAGGDLWEIA